ncbi:MAG: aldo/keto reductase [Limisphaerales bacterium]
MRKTRKVLLFGGLTAIAGGGIGSFMKYRQMGKTGLMVSVVGVGTWQFGGEWGHDFTQGEVDAILDQAHECGINLIDTAECYGDHLSERFIGDYLSRRKRSDWIVATKFGHCYDHTKKFDAFSAAAVREQLEASLRALKTDYVDVYQFHSGSDAEYFNEPLWEMLRQQKDKARCLGVSISSKGELVAQAREARRLGIDVFQVVYNRLDRRSEQLYFPHAEREQIGVFARVPLAHGLLSGKYTADSVFSGKDWRVAKFDKQRMTTETREVDKICRTEVPEDLKLSQWALAWCLKNQTVSAVIPGCKSPAHVKDNAAAVDLIL